MEQEESSWDDRNVLKLNCAGSNNSKFALKNH